MVKETDFIAVNYRKDLWELADSIASKNGIYEYSKRDIQGNQIGCLGEVVVDYWFKANGVHLIDERDCTTHDFRSASAQLTIEVKTKDRTVQPRIGYECSVPDYNHLHQRPDFFIFVSLFRDDGKKSGENDDINRYRKAYILGAISMSDFERHSVFWKKDSVDPKNGMKFWTDCNNVLVKYLTPIKSMLPILG